MRDFPRVPSTGCAEAGVFPLASPIYLVRTLHAARVYAPAFVSLSNSHRPQRITPRKVPQFQTVDLISKLDVDTPTRVFGTPFLYWGAA